ncbi:MAG: RNA 2',3'-cyclic phosphodiesterase [Syntrophales bacterium]|nr:RNA 2',3'-cyclic phosphodiesterase [Syntrophales bacterium]
MNSEKSVRAFLAIEPPAEILKEIGDIQNRLKKSIAADVRWTRPEGIHLTLKFFGNISESEIAAVSQVVEKHTAAFAPLQLEVRTLGVFPSLKRPRVLWIGLQGDTAPLVSLQKNLERGFEDCGFAREERPLRPHLTLGRIKAVKETAGLEKTIESGRDFATGSFCAAGLALFKSDLTPQGAVYTKLAWFPFDLKSD